MDPEFDKTKKIEEKKLDKKSNDPNTEFYKRVITLEKFDGTKYEIHQEVKKIKDKRQGTKGVADRMKIVKFGDCAGQSRGTLEEGIIRREEEIRIVDRKKEVYQEGLREKFKKKAKLDKETLWNQMEEEKQRERKENMHKINPEHDKEKSKPREAKDTDIKVTGFNPSYEEFHLKDLFSKVGMVRRVRIVRDKHTKAKKSLAYLEFYQDTHVQEAIDRFHDRTVGGCVLCVTRPVIKK